jgi:polar amino acid transport system substrate-binding protein
MKKLLSVLLALLLVFALAACNTPDADTETDQTQDESDLSYVQGNGELIIGYTIYEPMNYTDENGTFTGFDTELATLVCEKLGVEPKFIEINWDTKEVELNARSIDCIWNGLTILPDRLETMEITKPYVKNAQVILMKADAAYDGTESLIDKILTAEQGSAGEDTILGDDNLSQADYVPKTMQIECLMEIKAGSADAAVLDLTLAKTMTGEGTNYTDLAIVDRLGEEDYGVAFRKGSDICSAVNKIFDEFTADGTMSALADKYGLDLSE